MGAEVSERELASLRRDQQTFMPQRGKIRRKQYMGDDEFAYSTIAQDVPCRFTPGFGMWRVVADRYQGITAFTVTVPWDQDLAAGDVVLDETDRAFEIRDVRAPSTYQTARQALADLVTD